MLQNKKVITERREIDLLWANIRMFNHWFLELSCPDDEGLQAIGEKAKEGATKKLSRLSARSLYVRYKEWKKDPFPLPGNDYYGTFLNSLVWDLGLESLRGLEAERYCEIMNLTIKFI